MDQPGRGTSNSFREGTPLPDEVFAIPRATKHNPCASEVLTIFVTSRCPLACAHCFAPPEHIGCEDSTPTLIDAALQACDEVQNIAAIQVAGGEPLLRPDLVHLALSRSRRAGVAGCVVTSGFWAGTQRSAKTLLAEAGRPDALILSVDRFHRVFVPSSCIRNAIEAAALIGVREVILLVTLLDGNVQELSDLLRPYADLAPEYSSLLRFSVNYFVPSGRGSSVEGVPTFPASYFDMPCDRLTGLAVHTSGDVYACCGPVSFGRFHMNPLHLGNLLTDSWNQVRATYRSNGLIAVLKSLGPYQYARIIERGLKTTILEKHGYTTSCDVCADLVRFFTRASVEVNEG